MKATTAIVLLVVGLVVSCATTRDTPKQSEPIAAKIEAPSLKDKIVHVITRKAKPTKPQEPAAKGKLPICRKSSMPGFANGDAMTAAIDGFNARGVDIDTCIKRLREWAKNNNVMTE